MMANALRGPATNGWGNRQRVEGWGTKEGFVNYLTALQNGQNPARPFNPNYERVDDNGQSMNGAYGSGAPPMPAPMPGAPPGPGTHPPGAGPLPPAPAPAPMPAPQQQAGGRPETIPGWGTKQGWIDWFKAHGG